MIGIPIALVAFNAGEWLLHKYVLHGLGRNKRSFWSFHWHEHHRESRQADMVDPHYERPLFGWHAQSKEALALLGAGLFPLPLLPVAPFFVGTVWYSLFNYYRIHKRAHCDPEWGRQNVPWHVDHHLGPDQHANWCVSYPWFDELMGTRKPYVGTEREARDRKHRADLEERRRREASARTPVPEAAQGQASLQ
jgi:sterol desaturase/sphingolipid hydroxylase (fatty acid hydroxylase superfamily)